MAPAFLQPWYHTLKELSFTMYGMDCMVLSHKRGIALVASTSSGSFMLLRFYRPRPLSSILWAQATFFDFSRDLEPKGDALKSTLPTSIRELRLFGYGNPAPALQG